MYYKINLDRYNVNMELKYLIAEHSRVLDLAEARTRTFKDHKNNYYWKRLEDIEWLIELKQRNELK